MLRYLWFVLLALGFQSQVDALHHCDRGDAPNATRLLKIYESFDYKHSIITSNDLVQKLFNLGLALTAGYNQPEARRAFRAALKQDNLCAMCWWGLANARGPFQNKFALAQPSGGNLYDSYYTEEDVKWARLTIQYAAALVGLEYFGNATRTMTALASQLQSPSQQQPQGTPVKRLMKRMQDYKPCRGPAAVETGAQPQASGRRRMLGHAPDHSDGPGGDDDNKATTGPGTGSGAGNDTGATVPTAASPSPPPPSSSSNGSSSHVTYPWLSRLDLERYYIAALFDRLSVNVTSGPLWEAAEARYVQDMEYVASCFMNDTQPDDRALALALAAEALANFSPWQFAVSGNGAPNDKPTANTSRIVNLLKESLYFYDKQPLALHLMIHVTEELPAKKLDGNELVAGEGLWSADQLRGTPTGSGLFPTLDHLQHMPSHTYVRVGEWNKAVKSNEDALWASIHVSRSCLSPLYAAHNVEMLVFAANLAGRENTSVAYSRVLRDLARFIPDAPSIIGPQWSAPLLTYTLYGKWDLVRAEPMPDKAAAAALKTDDYKALQGAKDVLDKALLASAPLQQNASKPVVDVFDDPAVSSKVVSEVPKDQRGTPLQLADFSTNQADSAAYALAVWLYAQTMALTNSTATAQLSSAATGSGNGNASDTAAVLMDAAKTLQGQLGSVLKAAIPPDTPDGVPVGPGPGMGVLAAGYQLMATLMSKMAEARLALMAGDPAAAVTALKAAVELEEAGGYQEPPRLAQQPARQCLGLAQLHAGSAVDAANTFFDDLDRYPRNPWSVRGLMKAAQKLPEDFTNAKSLAAVSQRAQAYLYDPTMTPVRKAAEQLPGICPALGPDPSK